LPPVWRPGISGGRDERQPTAPPPNVRSHSPTPRAQTEARAAIAAESPGKAFDRRPPKVVTRVHACSASGRRQRDRPWPKLLGYWGVAHLAGDSTAGASGKKVAPHRIKAGLPQPGSEAQQSRLVRKSLVANFRREHPLQHDGVSFWAKYPGRLRPPGLSNEDL